MPANPSRISACSLQREATSDHLGSTSALSATEVSIENKSSRDIFCLFGCFFFNLRGFFLFLHFFILDCERQHGVSCAQDRMSELSVNDQLEGILSDFEGMHAETVPSRHFCATVV